MKPLPYFCQVILLSSLTCSCETTRKFWTLVNNLAVGVYKATPRQTRLANQRAAAAFEQFSTQQRKALEELGTRYLAVRTADPTPAQWTEIRRDMQKPGPDF
jgi:hypothetical protein